MYNNHILFHKAPPVIAQSAMPAPFHGAHVSLEILATSSIKIFKSSTLPCKGRWMRAKFLRKNSSLISEQTEGCPCIT